MILLSKTFETYTPESIENGEAEETGFVFQDEPYTFKELVRLIRMEGFTAASCSPASGSPNEWLSGESEPDYQTGEETIYSLHYSHRNAPRAAKYWTAAFKAANIIKG
jgi:hypothetical protein